MDALSTMTWGQLLIVCVQTFGLGIGLMLVFDTLMGIGTLLAIGWAALGQRH